jgi:hypothetical protein
LREYANFHVFSKPTEIDSFYTEEKLGFIPWITVENQSDVLNFIQNTKAKLVFGHFELNGYEVIEIDYKTTSLDKIKEIFLANNDISYVFTHLTFHNTQHNLDQELQLYKELNQKYGMKFIHILQKLFLQVQI